MARTKEYSIGLDSAVFTAGRSPFPWANPEPHHKVLLTNTNSFRFGL